MLEDYDRAIAHGHAAVAAHADYTDAHNNLGYAQHMSGDLDNAEASYTRALAIDPDYAPAHNNLGNIRKERGDQSAPPKPSAAPSPVRRISPARISISRTW